GHGGRARPAPPDALQFGERPFGPQPGGVRMRASLLPQRCATPAAVALFSAGLAAFTAAFAPAPAAYADDPKPAPSAAPAAGASAAPQCVLRGTYPGPKGTQIFDAPSGGRAIAGFTGGIQPMALTDLPADPTTGRARVSTSSGSASFRIDGWAAPSAFAVFTARDVPVVAGHVWISEAQRVKLVQATGSSVAVDLSVPGTAGQTVRATVPC